MKKTMKNQVKYSSNNRFSEAATKKGLDVQDDESEES